MTIQCEQCKQSSKPVYKTEAQLPFDYEHGFFCSVCGGRFSTDVVLWAVIQALEKTSQDASSAHDPYFRGEITR